MALLGAGVILASGAASQEMQSDKSGIPMLPAGTPKGYVALPDLPDSLALLPPPPAPGSAAMARDEEVNSAMARAPGTPRFDQAASDADLHRPHVFATFACAAGMAPDPQKTPTLVRLLGKSMIDVGLSTYRAKNHYQRTRPFVAHGGSTCFAPDEAVLPTTVPIRRATAPSAGAGR